MTIEVGGGGGIFRTETFVFSQTIASGGTGDLVTIGTAGKVTKLVSLATTSSSTLGGISVEVDGETLVGPATLSDDSPSVGSGFYVSQGSLQDFVQTTGSAMGDVIGEFITIKTSATTNVIIGFSYQTGVIK